MLNTAQHGFRKYRSSETQLILTVQDLANGLNDGEQIDAILLDLSKTFDKVPHQRLLGKLEHYGVRGNLNRWIADFLTHRQQEVVLEVCIPRLQKSPQECHKEQSSDPCCSLSTSRTCQRPSLLLQDSLPMTLLSTGSSPPKRIKPFSRKILINYRSGKETGSCSLIRTNVNS